MNRKDRVEKAIQIVKDKLDLYQKDLDTYKVQLIDHEIKLAEWRSQNSELLQARDHSQALNDWVQYYAYIEKIPLAPKRPDQPSLDLKKLKATVKGQLMYDLMVSGRLASELIQCALSYHKLA